MEADRTNLKGKITFNHVVSLVSDFREMKFSIHAKIFVQLLPVLLQIF